MGVLAAASEAVTGTQGRQTVPASQAYRALSCILLKGRIRVLQAE